MKSTRMLCIVLLTAMSAGAAVGVQKLKSATSVVDAAEAKQWERMSELLGSGHDVNATQPDGMTALHWAIHYGVDIQVSKLLSAGADANLSTEYGISPLQIAVTGANARIVDLLLDAGSSIEHKAPGGVTLLMLAAQGGRASVVRSLLKSGANVDAQERKGQTALMWAADVGNIDAVDVLIKSKANVELSSHLGFTALMFAARDGRLEVVRQLCEAGADVNAAMFPSRGGGRTPRKGSSALSLAVESGHFEIAMQLIQFGADPNDQRNGFTPLHILSWVRKPNRGEGVDGDPPPRGSGQLTSIEFVHRIVAAGADVNTRLKGGKSGKAVLNHKGATPFLFAARTADISLMKALVEAGADPTITNADECTAIMAAAGIGVRAVGEYAGTEPEVIASIDYLMALGLDPNAVDKNRETAMHGAAYRNYPRLVEHLARRGADPKTWDQKNKHGWTPVMIAQGKRPGSFKPSPVTVAALRAAKLMAGN